MAITERGSGDGTFITAGRQSALGTPVATNAAPNENIIQIGDDINIGGNAALSTFTTFTGEGPLTITVSNVRNGATLAITGQRAGGTTVSETLTYATGDDATKTTTNSFAHTALTITPAGWTAGDQADVSVDLPDTPGMIQDRFGTSSITLNETGEFIDSNNFRSFGASAANIPGARSTSGGFNGDAEVLKLMQIMRWVMAPNSVSSTELTDQDDVLGTAQTLTTALDASSATFSGTNTATPNVPSQLHITLSAGATTAGTLTIVGKRRTGNLNIDEFNRTEVVNVNTTDTEYTTVNSYSELISITPGGGLAGTGTYNIDYQPDQYQTVMRFNPNLQALTYLTLAGAKGGVPFVAQDWVVNSFTLNATETGIGYVLDGFGSRMNDEQTILGGTARRIAFETSALTTNFAPKDDIQLRPQLGTLYFGQGASRRQVAYTSIDIVITQNYEFSTGSRGSNYRQGVVRNGDREVLFNPTPILTAPDDINDVFETWQTIERDDRRVAVQARFLAYDSMGKEFRVDFDSSASQFAESPATSVTGDGPIDQPLSFKGLSSTTEPSELVVTFVGPEYTEA